MLDHKEKWPDYIKVTATKRALPTIIVQARMTSSRLPGKILKDVNGKSLLEYEIERLRQTPDHPEIWLATTTNSTDDPTCALAKRLNIPVFRGSEDDVLARYYACAKEARAQSVVRITADCPLIDPDIIAEVIRVYRSSDADYVSNTLERTFPRGLDTEVFSFRSLEKAFEEARETSEREHVTPYIRSRGRTKPVSCASGNFARYRWTVDTREDFELIRLLLDALYPTNPNFRMNDVLQILAEHPDWVEINADVEQKKE